MRTNTLATLVTFLSVGISSVSAGCYGDDALSVKWYWREDIDFVLNQACHGSNGFFAGTFGPGQTKRFCREQSLGKDGYQRNFFEITNLNGGASFDLGNTDCYNRMHDEVWGCGAGGESTISGWKFR